MGLLGKGVSGGLGLAAALLVVLAPQASSRAGFAEPSRASVTTTTASTPPPTPPTITLKASTTHIESPHPVILSGRVTGARPGRIVRLWKHQYPYRDAAVVRTVNISRDGSFVFVAVFPDRDTSYTAALLGSSVQATVLIHVTGRSRARVTALPLGRMRVTLVVYHPRDLRWGNDRVHWSFALGYHGPFHSAPTTRTRAISPTAIRLTTAIALPPGRFRWRACFHARDDHALEDPRTPPGCSGRGYHGSGSAPFGFPSATAIARAEAYLNSRGGHTALAVVTSEGRQYGVRIHDHFITGSVVKAMLLVAYLRRLHDQGQHYVDSYSNSFLYPMIHVSDNNAATQCWSIVGNSGLYSVAAAAGMTDFSVTTDWGSAILSAADQSTFFFEQDSLIPREFVGYARYLLSTIADYESWGIPAIARPLGYTVFFKGGWRPSPDIYLVHQIARLEGHRVTFAMAVMTDGDPDMGYGIDTIQGTTSALLR